MLEIEKEETAGTIQIRLKGILDSGTVSKLNDTVDGLSDVKDGIEIDCKELTGVSGAGFEVLLRLTKMTRAFGRECRITNVSDDAYELFKSTGLAEILTIERLKDGI